jgi:NhaP-type Na+/H+ or K+/H+ antiporter
LPRVTLLLLLGILVGPGGLGWLPAYLRDWYPMIATMALGMIGFLMGGTLTGARLRKLGSLVAWVSLAQVLVTYIVVAAGLVLFAVPVPIALLLAAIATATDPAATHDVVQESGRDGPFTTLLLGVVAIDDAWGLIVFSMTLVAVQMLLGNGAPLVLLQQGFYELCGALVLGLVLGVPVAFASGRLDEDRPLMVEALGAVLLCVGLARWLEVSYLLACVTLGCAVANLARHHRRPFRAL